MRAALFAAVLTLLAGCGADQLARDRACVQAGADTPAELEECAG